MPRTAIHTTRVIPATNNEEVLGNDIQLHEAHGSSMRETEDFEKKRKTIKDFCNRLKRMTSWMKNSYPAYYNVGVVQLSDEQKADKRRYHTQEEDFRYSGLNVQMVKAFMSANKFKPGTENQYSYEHMRKYHNAIQHGAYRACQSLPQSYVLGMDKFLLSLRKEKTQAKKNGHLDEHEADPISFSFYSSICEFALLTGDIFTCAYTVCQ